MKITLMLILIIMLTTMMFFLSHPLSMGLTILLQTTMICLLSGMMINTYWFSYILFLTFLGGMLVLFIYVSTISSNELFKFSINITMYVIIMTIMFYLLIQILIKYKMTMNITLNEEMKMFFENFIFFNNENKLNISKLYNNQTYMMMSMMVIYLLITLIAVVKITNNIMGPLRTMN